MLTYNVTSLTCYCRSKFQSNDQKMGQAHPLPVEEGFSREEVSRLERRFKKLDLDRSGTISVGELLSIPELKENPLVNRVVNMFDEDLSGEVVFKGKTEGIYTTNEGICIHYSIYLCGKKNNFSDLRSLVSS